MKTILSGIYKHYKGNLYNVMYIAKHTETLEEMVVYSDLNKKNIWVRPKAMFEENVVYENIVKPRFEFIKLSNFLIK